MGFKFCSTLEPVLGKSKMAARHLNNKISIRMSPVAVLELDFLCTSYDFSGE